MLFLYLISEDKAQDSSHQLEQEDHCQRDTELQGGNSYNTLKCNLFCVYSLEDRFHEILRLHVSSAVTCYLLNLEKIRKHVVKSQSTEDWVSNFY